MKKMKIGFVIPWYGEDLPGGEELKLRELSRQLQRAGMEIEILTTCVRDRHADWGKLLCAGNIHAGRRDRTPLFRRTA